MAVEVWALTGVRGAMGVVELVYVGPPEGAPQGEDHYVLGEGEDEEGLTRRVFAAFPEVQRIYLSRYQWTVENSSG